MDYKGILGTGLGLQATSLAISNLPGKCRRCRHRHQCGGRGMFCRASRNMLGIGLIGAQAEMIGAL